MPRIELHTKIHVRLTDIYGQNYVGITPSISIIGADLDKPAQNIEIEFSDIVEVTVVEENDRQRYFPAPEGAKHGVTMKFNVVKLERTQVTENGKTLEKLLLTSDLPDERIVLSINPVDFERFEREIMQIEPPSTEAPEQT
jgi:hypothetical protein